MSDERANPPAAGVPPADTAVRDRTGESAEDAPAGDPFDYIDEAIEETMIASDPPAWTPQTGIGAPGREARRDKGGERRD
jgi:hypothetical protein